MDAAASIFLCLHEVFQWEDMNTSMLLLAVCRHNSRTDKTVLRCQPSIGHASHFPKYLKSTDYSKRIDASDNLLENFHMAFHKFQEQQFTQIHFIFWHSSQKFQVKPETDRILQLCAMSKHDLYGWPSYTELEDPYRTDKSVHTNLYIQILQIFLQIYRFFHHLALTRSNLTFFFIF